jgi:hypothetical protein
MQCPPTCYSLARACVCVSVRVHVLCNPLLHTLGAVVVVAAAQVLAAGVQGPPLAPRTTPGERIPPPTHCCCGQSCWAATPWRTPQHLMGVSMDLCSVAVRCTWGSVWTPSPPHPHSHTHAPCAVAHTIPPHRCACPQAQLVEVAARDQLVPVAVPARHHCWAWEARVEVTDIVRGSNHFSCAAPCWCPPGGRCTCPIIKPPISITAHTPSAINLHTAVSHHPAHCAFSDTSLPAPV